MDPSQTNGLQEATLLARFDNGFPIELIVQLYFCGEADNGDLVILDSLVTGNSTVEAAELDDNGNFVASTESELRVKATSKKLAGLNGATKILIDMKVQSAEDGTKAGKFYTTSKMGVRLGLVATVSIPTSSESDQ
jgi:hypothetical protein